MRTLPALAFISSLLALALPVRAGDPLPSITFEDALKLPPGQSVVLQPATVTRGDTLRVSLTRFGDGSVKPGRAKKMVRIVVFERNPGTGAFTKRNDEVFDPTSAPFFSVDLGLSDVTLDGNNRGHIIAILIGLKQAGAEPPTTAPLPPDVGFTVTQLPPTGIGLLLPAVQKVREAAAR